MGAASDYVGSCTTAAELKSNVARCLYSPRVIRSSVRLYTLSISLRLFGRYFLFPATRAVIDRSPANLITICLSIGDLFLLVSLFFYHLKRFLFYFRNKHVDLLMDFLMNTESAKCHFELLLIFSRFRFWARLSYIQRYNYFIITAFDYIRFFYFFSYLFFSYYFLIYCKIMIYKYVTIHIFVSSDISLER